MAECLHPAGFACLCSPRGRAHVSSVSHSLQTRRCAPCHRNRGGCSTGTMRGEAGLPRRVTPVGGPGTRVRTYMQAPGQTWYGEGHAKKEVGVGRGRTGGSVRVERRLQIEGCLFAWCLSEETSRVSSRTQTDFGDDKSTSLFLLRCQHE